MVRSHLSLRYGSCIGEYSAGDFGADASRSFEETRRDVGLMQTARRSADVELRPRMLGILLQCFAPFRHCGLRLPALVKRIAEIEVRADHGGIELQGFL